MPRYLDCLAQAWALNCVLIGVICTSHMAQGATITFTKIADTHTVIPNGVGTFSAFGTVSLDREKAAFRATGINGQQGIYIFKDRTLTRIADTNTVIPEGMGNFTHVGPVSLSGENVAFDGGGENQGGIYTDLGGSLRRVADTNTAIPDGTGNFTHLDQPSMDGGTIAFVASGTFVSGSGLQSGIYTETGEILTRVADTNTVIPDGTGNFTSISSTPASFDDGSLAFEGFGDDQTGIYSNVGGTLIKVADLNTSRPNDAGNFTAFEPPSLDQGVVAFTGKAAGESGIYKYAGESLTTIVDTSMTIPSGAGTFGAFGKPSLDDGNIAFEGHAAGQHGIYAAFTGPLIKVIDRDDMLDGKALDLTGPTSFNILSESLSGDSIAFVARFSDGSSGIYIATIEIMFFLGDMDIDEDVDFDDIDDFILALNFPAAYEALYGVSPSVYGDMDQDGNFDFDDIDGFVAALRAPSATGPQAIPEPSTLLLTALGLVVFAGCGWRRHRVISSPLP